jgi:poly-gamma-glutamate capsule biosynthesis protein CapA/YwtB (metallophosphatase superfamily)
MDMPSGAVKLFCCGDVMTGRGVDQILAHRSDPELREPAVTDARTYVRLAEAANGPIPWPVQPWWPWGDALAAIDAAEPDLRVINLETSVTTSDDFADDKAIHYRMHPANIGCVTAASPDVCVLSNNHVLDFGPRGLAETLQTLAGNGITPAGAGLNSWEATQPVRVRVGSGTRMRIFAFGMASSGVPDSWRAGRDRPGVNFLSRANLDATIYQVRRAKRAADIVVVSVHWGSNWGYQVPLDQIRLAHKLVDAGADLIHGHSSHHPRPMEIYRDRLILYGCGDLINDYEGIGVRGPYRDDLRLLYFPLLHPTGLFAGMHIVVLQASQMRLHLASKEDTRWLVDTLNDVSMSARLIPAPEGEAALEVVAVS